MGRFFVVPFLLLSFLSLSPLKGKEARGKKRRVKIPYSASVIVEVFPPLFVQTRQYKRTHGVAIFFEQPGGKKKRCWDSVVTTFLCILHFLPFSLYFSACVLRLHYQLHFFPLLFVFVLL